MEFSVRTGKPEEAKFISRLAEQTFPAACPPGMPDEAIEAFIGENLSPSAFEGYLSDPRFEVMVAEARGGEVVGYTLVDGRPVDDPAIQRAANGREGAYLSKLYVAESVRGHGISAELLRMTLEAAKRQGHRYVWLGVNQQNKRANAFYARLGFEIAGEREFLVGGFVGHDYIRVIALETDHAR